MAKRISELLGRTMTRNMVNEKFSDHLEKMAFLLELKSENPFKIKAFQNAARILRDETEEIAVLVETGKIISLPGVGKGTQALAKEFVATKKIEEFEALKKEFPETIFELREVRGLGPKKCKVLFTELGIASLSELEYACRENRLLDLKGFGEKTQTSILANIEELKKNRNFLLLPQAQFLAEEIKEQLREKIKADITIVGEVARSLEIISRLEFYAHTPLKTLPAKFHCNEIDKGIWEGKTEEGFPIFLFEKSENELEQEAIFRLSSAPAFWKKEANHFKALAWLPAEAREEENIAHIKMPQQILEEKNIRGVFHMHTKWSDGANSLEEMVKGCVALGYEYMGISDHSQSAFYANGLKESSVYQQKEEINTLQKKYPEIKIFHGIESDILADGSLDYPKEILESFDFVIASVHGQFRMSKEEMTKRICRALENPYTTWLGHSTGRLLLGRKGYEVDMEKILQTASEAKKGIELNSNPYRLDLDWRHLHRAKEWGIPIGIFPDAHSVEGLKDVKYGVLMARKALLTPKDVVNTKSRAEMEKFLNA